MRNEHLGPPYGPPANLRAVFSLWRERGMPPRIDRAWFERSGLSGNLATRNLHALRYLRLVDTEGRPTERAERLRSAPSAAYAASLAAIVRTAYARIWASCDPATATRAEIDDAFRHESPPAQRSRMVACFIGLCADAGIRAPERAPAPSRPPRRAAPEPFPIRVAGLVASPPLAPAAAPAPPAPDVLALLMAKFPDFDPVWPDNVKEKWFDAFARLRDEVRR